MPRLDCLPLSQRLVSFALLLLLASSSPAFGRSQTPTSELERQFARLNKALEPVEPAGLVARQAAAGSACTTSEVDSPDVVPVAGDILYGGSATWFDGAGPAPNACGLSCVSFLIRIPCRKRRC